MFWFLVAVSSDFRVFHSQNRRARLRSNRRGHAFTNEKTPRNSADDPLSLLFFTARRADFSNSKNKTEASHLLLRLRLRLRSFSMTNNWSAVKPMKGVAFLFSFSFRRRLFDRSVVVRVRARTSEQMDKDKRSRSGE